MTSLKHWMYRMNCRPSILPEPYSMYFWVNGSADGSQPRSWSAELRRIITCRITHCPRHTRSVRTTDISKARLLSARIAAKKLKFLLTALEGGVVLGLLCDAYLPVNSTVQKIPWIKDKLTQNQVLNLLPLLIAATGALVQLIQLLSIRAEQKALAIPTGEERDLASDSAAGKADASDSEAAREEEAQPDEETISMVQAEEVLVAKAKELTALRRN